MTKFRVLFRKTWRIFSSVNHNNVYGRWITTWYLRQMKRTANSTTVDSTSGRKSSPRKIYKKKLRKSEIVDLKFSVSSKAVLFFFSPLSVVRPTQILGIFQKKRNDLVKPIFTWNNSFNLKNEHSNSIEKNKNKNRNIFVHFVNPNMWMLTFNFILGYQGSSYSETSCNSFFFSTKRGNTDCRRFSKMRSIEFATKAMKRGKFTVKIIFFMRSIFPADLGQPFHRFTVSFILQSKG